MPNWATLAAEALMARLIREKDEVGFYEDRIFPRLNDWMTGPLARPRQKLLSGARGRVVEIGFGTGLSAQTYPPLVTEVIGIEPTRGMAEKARERIAERNGGPRLQIMEARAEQLPLETNSFDSAISFLVLCTVSDPVAAIGELRRVLKPGGVLLFFEHVLHKESRFWSTMQHNLNPVWRKFSCGCNVNRDTGRLLREAGFEFSWFEEFNGQIPIKLVNRIIRGTATVPS